MMPVISADWNRWGPVRIMPGVQQKYWTNAEENKDFMTDFFPNGTLLVHRTHESMKKEYFVQWVEIFIIQLAELHRNN